jgi:hypothetical protein
MTHNRGGARAGTLRRGQPESEVNMGKLVHGQSNSPTYISWKGMHDRCKYRPGYSQVSVCERWSSFAAFLEDMGERPDGMTIDRIDSQGNYEPTNCRWADIKTQLDNRNCTSWITHNGETKTQADWAASLGINRQTLNMRLQRGWSIQRAVTTPPRQYPRRRQPTP